MRRGLSRSAASAAVAEEEDVLPAAVAAADALAGAAAGAGRAAAAGVVDAASLAGKDFHPEQEPPAPGVYRLNAFRFLEMRAADGCGWGVAVCAAPWLRS